MKVAVTNTRDEEGQIVMEAETAIKCIEDMQEQLSDLSPLSVISTELNEQRATVEKIYSAVLNMEGDITLLRAKLMDQMKKVPNSKQKAVLDNLSALWNPLLEEIKRKHANAERAFDLVNQLETSLKSLTMQVDENRLKLNEISRNKASFIEFLQIFNIYQIRRSDNDIANLIAMKQEVDKQELELSTLETLLHKLEVITTGPSLRKLGREVENATGDLRALLKDIKNILQKAQTSKDVQKQFSRTKEEAQILIDTARETAESLKENDGIPSITKEVLLKSKHHKIT
ncbi:unnamed protein product [Onchocerca flexuosa]|uniref:Nesprin-1 n=1 Tax=Onchocerca flexuosa TaxID=387005 RepID=A0A183HLE5_9BILA|nr:unnamed protein product [Onchocerca flexuosa]